MTTGLKDRLKDFPADAITRTAVIRGENEEYRYLLSRVWDPYELTCVWIMLNPSTADGTVDDATIRKCMRFAWLWGHGGILVTNLFAWRSRHPKELLRPDIDPVGPENDRYLVQATKGASRVVCGWGALPFATDRAVTIPRLLLHSGWLPQCLGRTQSGAPKHPLMLAYATELEVMRHDPRSH